MKYKLAQSGDSAVATLTGDMIEGVENDLLPLARAITSAKLEIDCGGIGRINSIGVGQWTQFLGSLPAQAALTFTHCPVAFMGYANLLKKFVGRGKVTSFFAPFRCNPCNVSKDLEFESAKVKADGAFPPANCPKCRKPMPAEVDEDEYLIFLDY